MLPCDIRDPKFAELVDVNAGISQLITGLEFTEGPIWHPTYQSLLFSDIWGNTIYSWNENDGLVKRRMNSYMANGNAYDREGRLVTCEHATSRVTRTDLNAGTYETLASHYQGKQLNSPNDVVVKSDGTIYFTDPVSGRSAGYGVPREPKLPFSGVYRLDPETKTLTLLVDDFSKPNGLCFSPDESLLYVNDTDRHHIRVFAVAPDGTLQNGQLFADVVGEGTGVPDGMKVDEQGNVYSCGKGGIHLFDDTGKSLGVIQMPEHTTNFVFGGADIKTLYITASTSIYTIRVKIAGINTVGLS